MVGTTTELVSGITPAARITGQIKKIVHGRDATDVATLQFTGLDEILHVAGTLWPQRWSRLRRLTEFFIRERLDPDDILVRGAEAFIIAFGTRTGPAVRQAVDELARELNLRLAKEEAPIAQVVASIKTIGVGDLAASIAQGTPGRIAPRQDTIVIPTLGEVGWRFHPVWDVRREVVSCYFASPHHADTGMRVRGYQYEDLDAVHPDFADLDVESIRVSERALQVLRDLRKRAVIGVSLHISTLNSEAGIARVLTELDNCDPTLSTYRLIKITGMASGFPRMHLRSIIGSLRARAPKVVLTAAWHEPDVAGLIQCGATAFGFAYPDHVAGALSATANGTLLARFSAGVEAAHVDGVPLYVEGAIGPYLAREFRTAGADYICSPVIWPPRAAPDAVTRWPSSMLPN
jgi:hypothetical protein